MEIQKESIIELKLSIQKEEEDTFTIGSPTTRVYIRVPEDAVNIINIIDGKKSVIEVEKEYYNLYSEEVDVADFLNSLLELNLIKSINGKELYASFDKKTTIREKIFNKLGRISFSKPSIYIYTFSFFINMFFLLSNRDLIPSYKDFFVINHMGLNFLLFFTISWTSTFYHELAHFLAARKFGISTIFNVGIRYHWIVIEADMSPIWSIEKRKRYIPYLAGLFWDSIGLLLCTLVKLYINYKIILGFAEILSLLFFYRILWQFLFFLRTDLYFVLLNFFNLPELHSTVKVYLVSFFKKNIKLTYNKRERIIVQLYSIFVIFGFFFALFIIVSEFIPGIVNLIENVVYEIFYSEKTFIQIDGLIALSILLFQFFLWLKGAYNNSNYKRMST